MVNYKEKRELTQRGYSIKWCVWSAFMSGGPHHRKRLYIMAERNGFTFPQIEKGGVQKWDNMSPPRCIENSTTRIKRLNCLGNSVVPKAVQDAYHFLTTRGVNNIICVVPYDDFPSPKFKCGKIAENSKIEYSCEIPVLLTNLPTIWLNGSLYNGVYKPKKNGVISPAVDRKLCHGFPTPRRCMTHASNRLSERTSGDLGTFVRFAEDTPNDIRGLYLSPEFVEWLMGYPTKWTGL